MKLKVTLKYLARGSLPYFIFFSGLTILLFSSTYLNNQHFFFRNLSNYLDLSPALLYLIGFFFSLTSFNRGLNVFNQVSLSRRTQFVSFSLTLIWFSVALVLIATLSSSWLALLRHDASGGVFRSLGFTQSRLLNQWLTPVYYIVNLLIIMLVGSLINLLYQKINLGNLPYIMLGITFGVPILMFVFLMLYNFIFQTNDISQWVYTEIGQLFFRGILMLILFGINRLALSKISLIEK